MYVKTKIYLYKLDFHEIDLVILYPNNIVKRFKFLSNIKPKLDISRKQLTILVIVIYL